MKKSKITVEEQDAVPDKLGKLCYEKKVLDKIGWQYYVYNQADRSALHGIPTITISENNWDRDSNDFSTRR